MTAQTAKDHQADRGQYHQYQQEPEVRHQFPDQRIVLFIQRKIRPVLCFAFNILQHNELRQRQQRDGGQHRNTHALYADFPPALQRIA